MYKICSDWDDSAKGTSNSCSSVALVLYVKDLKDIMLGWILFLIDLNV